MENKPSTNLITAFKQGGTGNCVSIAIIKASIEIFGMDKVVIYSKNENGYNITMKDGYQLKLTYSELEIASKKSFFQNGTNDNILEYANFLFGAMAKRAQEENNDGNLDMSYQQATDTLNNGEYYLEGPHWLGLRHHIRYIGRKYCSQYPGVVRASKSHCAFITFGVEDNYGKPDTLSWIESKFFKFYRIANEPIY